MLSRENLILLSTILCLYLSNYCEGIQYNCHMQSTRLTRQASLFLFRRRQVLPLTFHIFRNNHSVRLYSSSSSSTGNTHLKPVREPPPGADMGPNPAKYTPYERWVRRLYQTNLFNPVKLGLQNIQDLHDALGSPMNNVSSTIEYIHATIISFFIVKHHFVIIIIILIRTFTFPPHYSPK